jgi:hypothetical protein
MVSAMNGQATNNAIAKITMGLDAVFATPPAQRAGVFAGVHRAIGLWLASLDTPEAALDEPLASGKAEFVRKARIYMRALKTYPASSEEWLEVFWAFRQMFDRWTQTPTRRPTASGRADSELDRLRHNPHLVLKEEDV